MMDKEWFCDQLVHEISSRSYAEKQLANVLRQADLIVLLHS